MVQWKRANIRGTFESGRQSMKSTHRLCMRIWKAGWPERRLESVSLSLVATPSLEVSL